jgi:Fic family protein
VATQQEPWPRLKTETRTWKSTLSPDLISRKRLELVNGPYKASVVPNISTLVPRVDTETSSAAEDASTALVRFDSEVGSLTAPFASILLRSESASSSQIENLTAGARAIAEAELGERESGNARQIVRNVRAMQAALRLSEHIDDATIIAMQAALLEDDHPEMTGHYRTEQVWIGASQLGPRGASFIPPHEDRVGEAMKDLERFIARSDLPVLTQAAIAHAQFETIHPFPDGNGRTGRAIVQAMLRRGGLTTHVTVPVSAGLLADIDRYFAALGSYREGDIDPIVRIFAEATLIAIQNGKHLADDVQRVQAHWNQLLTGVRRHSSARRLVEIALEQPVLNAEVAQQKLSVSKPVVYNTLAVLVDRGILHHATSRRRNQIWIADELITVLDEFAARAGRRSLPRT